VWKSLQSLLATLITSDEVINDIIIINICSLFFLLFKKIPLSSAWKTKVCAWQSRRCETILFSSWLLVFFACLRRLDLAGASVADANVVEPPLLSCRMIRDDGVGE
jgi:hypothetical protein